MKINCFTSKELTGLFLHSCLIVIAVVFTSTGEAAFRDHEKPARSVKIGLLIQESKYTSALQGAEMAVRIANRKGGLNGLPFQLVVRSMEGPWGTGSKQAVDLIFEEKVWALLGSHDGRNAHLVEQAATKSQVVFLSTWPGDPTLSQAFVPWFFNCALNDLQQAEALISEIYNKRKLDQVAVICENNYDSKQASGNLLKKIRLEAKSNPVQFNYEDYSQDINGLLDQINLRNFNSIILFCSPAVSLKIFRQIRQRKMNQSVFGTIYLMNENELTAQELQDFDNSLLIPSWQWSDTKSTAFSREYMELYGRNPGMAAAYAFDGMNLLIEAVRNAGSPDREKIQRTLVSINYEGVTGVIRFDGMGNRSGSTVITQVRNGMPSAPGK